MGGGVAQAGAALPPQIPALPCPARQFWCTSCLNSQELGIWKESGQLSVKEEQETLFIDQRLKTTTIPLSQSSPCFSEACFPCYSCSKSIPTFHWASAQEHISWKHTHKLTLQFSMA